VSAMTVRMDILGLLWILENLQVNKSY
jgi:hypothetical protein